MFANGCGGKGAKYLNKMLGLLPSSKLFHGACCFHDIVYALVVKESIMVHYKDRSIVLSSRLDCDIAWRKEMLSLCDTIKNNWYKKLMVWACNRNYRLVRDKGAKYYVHNHWN